MKLLGKSKKWFGDTNKTLLLYTSVGVVLGFLNILLKIL